MQSNKNNFFVRLAASAFTFAFVYVWHGTQPHVLIWSLLNFGGITLEATAKAIGGHPKYIKFEVSQKKECVGTLYDFFTI